MNAAKFELSNLNDIDSLVSNWGYVRTAEYNGRTASKGRQVLTVTDAAKVPADWNGDKNIAAKAIVEGKRGAQHNAFIYRNGFISVI